MEPFSAEEHAAISNAIASAEANTSGEIVVIVAGASDGYRSFALMLAALLALAVPLPLIYATNWPIEHIYLLQLIVFAVGAVLTQWEPLRIAITPTALKRARAHQNAVEQFIVQNLHTTEGRTGVLIFVSVAERFAEVIADEGIYRKVPPEMWEELIDELTAHIGRGTRTEGFIAAVKACGEVLAEHFPPGRGDCNELPNHLIVLDGPRRP